MTTPKLNFFRRICCRLLLCGGHVDHEQDADGGRWVGLRCATCKKLLSPIRSQFQDTAKAAQREGEK